MARSGSAHDVPVRSDGDTLLIRVWAHPGSDRDSIDGIDEFRKALVIRVRGRAIEGEANSGIVSLLSGRLGGCTVTIEAGHTSRLKLARARCAIPADEAVASLLGRPYNICNRKD